MDETLILMSSDHGEFLGDYGCFGKRSMHDVSSRIPLLTRYPKRFTAGQQYHEVASLVDIIPTVCCAAEIDYQNLDLDGCDLADIANGKKERFYVYSVFGGRQERLYMIASKAWKYVYSAGDNRHFFFDRIGDPKESRNLIGCGHVSSEEHMLRTALIDYLKNVGADDALDGDQFRVFSGWDKHKMKSPQLGASTRTASHAQVPVEYR